MSNLKDIVEEVQQTPSPRCWDAIASQLPAAGAAAGAGAATAGKAALGAGKIAAIVASSAAAITISAIAITKLSTTETPSDPANTNPTEIAANNPADSLNLQDTILLEEAINTKENNTIETPKNKQVTLAENSTPKFEKNTTTTTTTPIASPSTPTSTPATTTTSSNNSSSAVAQNTTPKPAEKTESKTEKTEQKPQKTVISNSESLSMKQNHQEIENENKDFDDFICDKPIKIEIPNIFTPNGDGVNDIFIINGLEYCENPALIVKNQQGKVVFQSRHYENNWDANGLPNGTYYYQFIYNIKHTQQIRTGTLMIRR